MRRLVRILLARFFAIVPKRYRYTAARYVSIVGAPIAWFFAPRDWRDLNSGVTIALWAVLRAMNRDEIEFDFPVDVEGVDILDEAQQRGRGIMLVTAHFRMNTTLGVWLRNRGWRFHAIRADPEERIFLTGTRDKLPYFLRSPHVLLQVRAALAAGELVYVAADSAEPVTHGFTIGDLHISDAAPRLAARWGTSMAYLETYVDRRGFIHAKITRGTADDLRAMFEKWLRVSQWGAGASPARTGEGAGAPPSTETGSS